jgi:hypothetical protein
MKTSGAQDRTFHLTQKSANPIDFLPARLRFPNIEASGFVPIIGATTSQPRTAAVLTTNPEIYDDWIYCPLGPQRIACSDGFSDGCSAYFGAVIKRAR